VVVAVTGPFVGHDEAVLVVGVLEDSGDVVFSVPLGHGTHPDVIAYDQGFALLRPIDASLAGEDLVVRVAVRPAHGEDRPVHLPRFRDADLDLDAAGIEPVVRQRVAAYAVVTSTRGLLATEYSDRTAARGRWGMPGGGLDPGEEPVAAVLREVVEETSQVIELGELATVQTSHWVGRSPRGVVEDFHAVRLIYRGSCPDPSDPVVLDEGGTTRSSRWVPLSEWPAVGWTFGWHAVLNDLLS
jgi:ADP-ribose pyrophosphatase YjhB (NUDIX family)